MTDKDRYRYGKLRKQDLMLPKRNIRTKTPSIRELFYKTLFRPIIEYSSPVWCPYTKSSIHRIEIVQKRAARRWTLCHFSTHDSVSNMLGELGWRSLENRCTDSVSLSVCFIRLCMVLLQCHYHHMLCMPLC